MTPSQLGLLDAPTNLGLKPPAEGAVPGCYKAPGALRDNGLLNRLGAVDAGVVTPPRYVSTWRPGDGVRNAEAIARYSQVLADRIGGELDAGRFPVVLGGDCSVLLGSALALRRRGRYGLAFLDGHDDFRHLGNAEHVGAAAGEDLALVTGRGEPGLIDIEGFRPYVRDTDVVVLGAREPELVNSTAAGISGVSSERIMAEGTGPALRRAGGVLGGTDGFWIHVDIDVLDPSLVSAVDSPDPNGLDGGALVALLRGLLAMPGASGLELTVFDPDLDPDGTQARLVTDLLVRALVDPPR